MSQRFTLIEQDDCKHLDRCCDIISAGKKYGMVSYDRRQYRWIADFHIDGYRAYSEERPKPKRFYHSSLSGLEFEINKWANKQQEAVS